MSDLVEFLHARIDEDEAQARDAIRLRDAVRPDYCPDREFRSWPDLGIPAVVVGAERALAECEAKRRIVEQHSDIAWGGYAVRDAVLGHLALPYADHPDYNQEWRR